MRLLSPAGFILRCWVAVLILAGFSITAVACRASGSDDAPRSGDPAAFAQSRRPAADSLIGTSELLNASVVLHHWQALDAIRQNAPDSALHHVQHILEALDGDHRAAMESVAKMLEDGDDHGAEHGIEEMLAGRAEPNLTPNLLHLQLAIQALANSDTAAASHHIRHVIEHAQEADRDHANEIATLLDTGREAEATEAIQAFAVDLAKDQVMQRRCAARPDTSMIGSAGQIQIAVLDGRSDRPSSNTASALRTIRGANIALSALGVSLMVKSALQWDEPAAETLHALADAAIEAFPGPSDEGLLVSITEQAFGDRRDGVHVRHAGSHAIVLVGRSTEQARSQVLAHEVGHVLGLWHETGTYMQSLGMPRTGGWSECQRDAVRELLG